MQDCGGLGCKAGLCTEAGTSPDCASLSQNLQTDTDADGTADVCDNCPQHHNPQQTDLDADGLGNVCDACPSVAGPHLVDLDGDETPSACDPLIRLPLFESLPASRAYLHVSPDTLVVGRQAGAENSGVSGPGLMLSPGGGALVLQDVESSGRLQASGHFWFGDSVAWGAVVMDSPYSSNFSVVEARDEKSLVLHSTGLDHWVGAKPTALIAEQQRIAMHIGGGENTADYFIARAGVEVHLYAYDELGLHDVSGPMSSITRVGGDEESEWFCLRSSTNGAQIEVYRGADSLTYNLPQGVSCEGTVPLRQVTGALWFSSVNGLYRWDGPAAAATYLGDAEVVIEAGEEIYTQSRTGTLYEYSWYNHSARRLSPVLSLQNRRSLRGSPTGRLDMTWRTPAPPNAATRLYVASYHRTLGSSVVLGTHAATWPHIRQSWWAADGAGWFVVRDQGPYNYEYHVFTADGVTQKMVLDVAGGTDVSFFTNVSGESLLGVRSQEKMYFAGGDTLLPVAGGGGFFSVLFGEGTTPERLWLAYNDTSAVWTLAHWERSTITRVAAASGPIAGHTSRQGELWAIIPQWAAWEIRRLVGGVAELVQTSLSAPLWLNSAELDSVWVVYETDGGFQLAPVSDGALGQSVVGGVDVGIELTEHGLVLERSAPSTESNTIAVCNGMVADFRCYDVPLIAGRLQSPQLLDRLSDGTLVAVTINLAEMQGIPTPGSGVVTTPAQYLWRGFPSPVPADCCTATSVVSCSSAAVAACVCAVEASCCSQAWSASCAAAAAVCGDCAPP